MSSSWLLKRTAFEIAKSFLAFNGYRIDSEAKEAYELLLRVTAGGASESEVEDWVATNLTESKSE
jgi:prophage maintenance system killer protein